MSDLSRPTVRLITNRVNEHRRTVPVDPVMRLSLFTPSGQERGTDLTEDDAIRLLHALSSVLMARRAELRHRAERAQQQ